MLARCPITEPTGGRGAVEEKSIPSLQLGYKPFLDGMRGIAIIAVILFHLGPHLTKKGFFSYHVLEGGHIGVDIFFVLSGFLITILLLEEWDKYQRISLKQFYARRALRLLPALLFLLIVYFLYTACLSPAGVVKRFLRYEIVALFYLSNWYRAFHGNGSMGGIGHTWSLSIEEQFYLIWPLMLVFLLRSRISRRKVIYCLSFLVLLIAVYRAVYWILGGSVARLYNGSDTRADALLIGCVVALSASTGWLPRSPQAIRRLRIASAIGVFLLVFVLLLIDDHSYFIFLGGFTMVGISVGALLLLLLANPAVRLVAILELPALVWIGRISYSLYLWHIPMFIVTYELFRPYHLLLCVPFSLALATFSYYCVEQPFLKLKKKFNSRAHSNNWA